MIYAPYRTDGKPYDTMFENNINHILAYIRDDDDDYQLMLVGLRGAGKSNLAQHALSIYMPPEKLHINLMALTRDQLATNWKVCSKQEKPRALCYDEANVSGRDAMSKWNKDLIDLYFSNRGQNIFHIWCNPTVKNIDRTFVDDCIKGIVVVKKPTTKLDGNKSPFRYYYWYQKKGLLRLLEDNISLKITNLLSPKIAHKYAWYMGWFKQYDGVLREPYLLMKQDRMDQKTNEFFKKYGNSNLIDRGKLLKEMGIHRNTIAACMGSLKENEDYFVTPTRRYKFTTQGVENLRNVLISRRRKMVKKE